ncbi:MAG: hypothetical protein VX335_04115 [Pseudomonadota bacterium]|nr:hypothetical protein [Pseudomonadota bacterium]
MRCLLYLTNIGYDTNLADNQVEEIFQIVNSRTLANNSELLFDSLEYYNFFFINNIIASCPRLSGFSRKNLQLILKRNFKNIYNE